MGIASVPSDDQAVLGFDPREFDPDDADVLDSGHGTKKLTRITKLSSVETVNVYGLSVVGMKW